MKVQEFTLTFNGDDLDADVIEGIINQGLQWYDDVMWKNYTVTKEGDEQND